MPTQAEVKLQVDAEELRALSRKLKRAEDGEELRQRLVIELKEVAGEGAQKLKGRLLAIPHRSPAHPKPAMSTYLASKTSAKIKTGGDDAGLDIVVKQTPKLRGFKMAARWLDRKQWRHPVFGNRNKWVTQRSPMPGYVEDTLGRDRDKYAKAVNKVMTRYANFIIHGKWGL